MGGKEIRERLDAINRKRLRERRQLFKIGTVLRIMAGFPNENRKKTTKEKLLYLAKKIRA